MTRIATVCYTTRISTINSCWADDTGVTTINPAHGQTVKIGNRALFKLQFPGNLF